MPPFMYAEILPPRAPSSVFSLASSADYATEPTEGKDMQDLPFRSHSLSWNNARAHKKCS